MTYSVFRWDPGSAGSLIVSLADVVRYGKTLTPETVAVIKDKLITKVWIPELGDANEYLAGAFYAENGGDTWNKYWLVEFMITKDDVIRTDHIPNMYKNSAAGNLQEYHIVYHGLKHSDEQAILQHLMEYSGYLNHISLVGNPYTSRMLQFFKQSSRHGEWVKPFIYTIDPEVKIPEGMIRYVFNYDEVFTDRNKFNEIIGLLSESSSTDEIWEFAQDYYQKNQLIVDWMEVNWSEIAAIYKNALTDNSA